MKVVLPRANRFRDEPEALQRGGSVEPRFDRVRIEPDSPFRCIGSSGRGLGVVVSARALEIRDGDNREHRCPESFGRISVEQIDGGVDFPECEACFGRSKRRCELRRRRVELLQQSSGYRRSFRIEAYRCIACGRRRVNEAAR